MFVDNEIQGTSELVRNVEKTLLKASLIPYNNAASVYETAGIKPDPRMGGSCLHKLRKMQEFLPIGLDKKTKIITSQVGTTTHFAMLLDLNGNSCYIDPFLWQSEPMFIDGPHVKNSVKTLQNMWTIDRESNENSGLFTVSFKEKEDVLVTHNFNNQLEAIPSPAAIPLRPHLPSFMMQITDPGRQRFYKIWYKKSEQKLNDIWVQNGNTAIANRLKPDGPHQTERKAIIKDIQDFSGISEGEMVNFFARAHDLELSLAQSMSESGIENPTT